MAEPGSVRMAARLALGQLLRQHRRRAGLSGAEVAQRLGWSQAKVSRIEAARVRADVADIQALTEIYEISSGEQVSLVEMAKEAAGPSTEWRNSTGLGLSRRQQDFVSLEAAASTIRHYQTMLIPGPLQTPEYTKQVFSTFSNGDPTRWIETRAARRAAILRVGGPKLQVVLTEMAIRWDPGPEGVLHRQLLSMAELVDENSTLDLRVLPMAGQKRAFLNHPVVIYRFDGVDAPLALIETTTTDVRVTDVDDVERLSNNLDMIVRDALSRIKSIEFVRMVAKSPTKRGS